MTLLSYGMWLGITFGVLSCVSYTAAAVAQRRLAVRMTEPLTGRRQLGSLLRHPLWWVSLVFNGGRAGFQVAAVSFAPLTVIQPLGVLVLIFGIPWSARLAHRKVSRAEWHGAAYTMLALGVLLAVTVTGDQGGVLSAEDSVLVGVGAVVLLAAIAGIAGRVPSASWRSYLLAAAAGIAFGVAAATVKTAVWAFGDGLLAGLTHPSALATAVIAVFGLFLAQAAYQGMDLGAPLGVTTLANPVAAALVGVVFMGETYAGGWLGGAVALLCGLVAAYGIRLLTVPANGVAESAVQTQEPEPRA
ncbi:DMT family transporter [Nocardiopsis metallicus]|uniref:Drug/metabolite transporter (DMT)-like permease n=1 Tax=Nocardiopsis metallicus TaxID=179819 RepID=A0A840W9P5_9ACTN|nr:DMT family transporter [Nocardiopsis metallicus]MBB5493729.1 drug/metabolite transporter (DMT)-like permease [Nocardiopsis metallicus]